MPKKNDVDQTRELQLSLFSNSIVFGQVLRASLLFFHFVRLIECRVATNDVKLHFFSLYTNVFIHLNRSNLSGFIFHKLEPRLLNWLTTIDSHSLMVFSHYFFFLLFFEAIIFIIPRFV